jgi:hypothetical protein
MRRGVDEAWRRLRVGNPWITLCDRKWGLFLQLKFTGGGRELRLNFPHRTV